MMVIHVETKWGTSFSSLHAHHSSMNRELPGYYWDEARKRYFPLKTQHWTAPSSPKLEKAQPAYSKPNGRNIRRIVDNMKVSTSWRETSYLHQSVVFQYMREEIHHRFELTVNCRVWHWNGRLRANRDQSQCRGILP